MATNWLRICPIPDPPISHPQPPTLILNLFKTLKSNANFGWQITSMWLFTETLVLPMDRLEYLPGLWFKHLHRLRMCINTLVQLFAPDWVCTRTLVHELTSNEVLIQTLVQNVIWMLLPDMLRSKNLLVGSPKQRKRSTTTAQRTTRSGWARLENLASMSQCATHNLES